MTQAHAPNPSPSVEQATPSPETTGAANPPAKKHLAHIDGLRALAAGYVMCVHILPRAWLPAAPSNLLLRLLAKVTTEAHFAVTAFIVISGYCLILPTLRTGRLPGGSWVFFQRRFVRIAPPFYLAFLLSWAILLLPRVAQMHPDAHVGLRQVLAHLFLVAVAVPGGLLPNNGVLWSVPVECAMYLFFPAMVWSFRRARLLITCAAATLLGCLLWYTLRQTLPGRFYWIYLGPFAFGAAAALLGNQQRSDSRWSGSLTWYALAAACLSILPFFLALGGMIAVEKWAAPIDLFVALGVAFLLVGCGCPDPNPLRKFLANRIFATVGLFSYSLYMLHYPLADLLEAYVLVPLHLGQTAAELVQCFVFLPALVGCSYLFYLMCERPFHLAAQRIGKK